MPDWTMEIRKLLAGLNLSAARETEIIEELSQHLEDRYQEMLAAGKQPYEAYRTAVMEIANSQLLTNELRRVETYFNPEPVVFGKRRRNMIEAIWQDVTYAIRMLRKNMGFTTVALISLALGIGANTAIFQLIDAVAMRSLPVPNPQNIVDVHITNMDKARGSRSSWHEAVNNPAWEQIRDRQQTFDGIFAWGSEGFDISPAGESRYADGLYVSGSYFPVLDVKPALGRLFNADDDKRGCASPGAVISYTFWQNEYGGAANVLGQKLMVNHHPTEIIGVSSKGFLGLDVGHSYDLAVPICWEATVDGEGNVLNSSTDWWLIVMGRLKPGMSIEQASAQMNAISPAVFESSITPKYPAISVKDYLDFKLAVYPAGNGISYLRSTYTNPLWLLLGIAGLVLLIACANLANLMLARASARQQEIAVRLALGASRWRLVSQLLTESLLLSIAGATIGVFLAGLLSEFMVKFIDTKVELTMDWRILSFTITVAIMTCILFGLVPAIRATRMDLASVIKAGSRSMSAGMEGFGLRRILVISQVALSLVLLVGALLFTQTLHNLLTQNTGFQQNGLMVTSANFSRLHIPVERRLGFRREMMEKIRTIPGVESAAETNIIPVSGSGWNNTCWLDGTAGGQKHQSFFSTISSNYFNTVKVQFLAGRDFDDHDSLESTQVAIVNESFARQFAGGRNPVGMRFWQEATPSTPERSFEIVGLVKDMKYMDLRQEFSPIAYLAASQTAKPGQWEQILIRSNIPISSVTPAIKKTLGDISPDIAINFQVLTQIIGDSLVQEKLMATLSGFFGVLAALLATVGLYGVMSYSVLQRRQELGIRVALGANQRKVMGMIIGESTVLLVIGLVIGGVMAIFTAKYASEMLYGLKPNDPLTLATAAGLLSVVALLAGYLPARRAARVDPMIALRNE